MKKLVTTLVLSVLCQGAIAQCTVNANAVAGITLQCDNTQGQTNRSGVAYNPAFNLYYSVDAGSTGYPIETFDASGTPVADIPQGFDYRGLWWNPNTNKLDGNEYSGSAVSSQNLDVSGIPLGTTTLIFAGAQPDGQSVGDYDYINNEIVYYNNGQYYRYDGTTNASLGTVTITGLPVTTSNLNSYTAFYTGCSGKEYGVYDYVNKRFYFIDKATGAYVATSQLPVSAPVATQFQASYANGKLWLFEGADYKWYSYEVLQACAPPAATITDTIGNVSFCQGDSVSFVAVSGVGYTYQWLNNNAPVAGATNDTFTTMASGTYSVIVTDGCSDTSAVTTVVANPLPVASISQSGNVLSVVGVFTTYQWLLNGGIISGATNATYTTTQVGTYSVIVTNTWGCTDTSTAYQYVSVKDLVIKDLNIYPNPSHGSFMINGHVNSNKAIIKVTDITGRMIIEEEVQVKNKTIEKQVDLPQLSAGTYMLFVTCDNERQVIPLTIN